MLFGGKRVLDLGGRENNKGNQNPFYCNEYIDNQNKGLRQNEKIILKSFLKKGGAQAYSKLEPL